MTATHFLVEAARNLKAKIAKKDEAMIAELEAQIAHIGLYRNAWAYLELREARQWVAALEANDAKRTRGRVTRLVGGLAQFLPMRTTVLVAFKG
jgi:hypothetical protein